MLYWYFSYGEQKLLRFCITGYRRPEVRKPMYEYSIYCGSALNIDIRYFTVYISSCNFLSVASTYALIFIFNPLLATYLPASHSLQSERKKLLASPRAINLPFQPIENGFIQLYGVSRTRTRTLVM